MFIDKFGVYETSCCFFPLSTVVTAGIVYNGPRLSAVKGGEVVTGRVEPAHAGGKRI